MATLSRVVWAGGYGVRDKRVWGGAERGSLRGASVGFLLLLGLIGQTGVGQAKGGAAAGPKKTGGDQVAGGGAKATAKPEKTAYDYTLPGADGRSIPVSTYKGKVLLVVNLAHGSSYNAQLPALEKLSETYKDKGLVVIGVPSNDFGASEPGTDAQVQKVYTNAKVTFPVMARASLTGVEELPLYGFLTKVKDVPGNGPVHWNYTKFLVDRKGVVVARFDPDVAPDSPEFLATLEQVMAGTYAVPKKKPHEDAAAEMGGDDDDF